MSASPAQREHAVARAGRIYSAIKLAAEAGQSCPTNRVLAERFSCGTARIVEALHFLEVAGMIEVERKSDSRIVTICASGKRTAPEVIWKLRTKARAA